MAEARKTGRWHPTRTSMVAGALVIAGFMLTGVSWWFLLLAAVGTFGPGLLRECGWLRDRDEFQRRADHRAGYHAFMATGLVAFLLVAFFRSGGTIGHPHRLATFFLALLWFTWFFSSLLAYWGAQRTAVRVLIAFGSVWLVFAVVSNLGPEWSGWAALLLHPLLAAPFFALAWLSTRWPRLAGGLLLAVGVGVFVLIEMPDILRTGNPAVVTEGVTLVLLVGPLLASGAALVASGGREALEDDGGDDERDWQSVPDRARTT